MLMLAFIFKVPQRCLLHVLFPGHKIQTALHDGPQDVKTGEKTHAWTGVPRHWSSCHKSFKHKMGCFLFGKRSTFCQLCFAPHIVLLCLSFYIKWRVRGCVVATLKPSVFTADCLLFSYSPASERCITAALKMNSSRGGGYVFLCSI